MDKKNNIAIVEGTALFHVITTMLRESIHCTSEREVREYMTAVNVVNTFCKKDKGYKTTLVATSGYMLSFNTYPVLKNVVCKDSAGAELDNPDFSFIIDRASIKKLFVLFPKKTSYNDGKVPFLLELLENKLHLQDKDNTSFDMHRFKDTRYPNVDGLFPETQTHLIRLQTKGTLATLKYLYGLTKGRIYSLRCLVENDTLTLSTADNRDYSVSVKVPIIQDFDNAHKKIEGKALFGVPVDSFKSAVSMVSHESFDFAFQNLLEVGHDGHSKHEVMDRSRPELKILFMGTRIELNDE